MECAAHAGTPATGRCSVCDAPGCGRCLAASVEGAPVCESCAPAAEERSRAIGSGLLVLVGAGYLAALAVGYLVFHARPIVGGLAAVVAIALGRALELFVRPALTRSPKKPSAIRDQRSA